MLHFNFVRWKNFLSTGNAWTEIQLDRSPITSISGVNGSGKSQLLDALCFVLFGKPFRKINKPQLVNSVNQKGTVVELDFTVNGIPHKIIRGIKPGIFEVYVNGLMTDQSASVKDYQDYLEKTILKLNFNSFTQIVILGSATFIPFMQLPLAQRREIIEDLLDIRIFTEMNLLLKERVQTNKLAITDVKNRLEIEAEKLKVHEKYINEINNKTLERNQKTLEEIENARSSIRDYETQLEVLNGEIESLQEKINDEFAIKKKQSDIKTVEGKLEARVKKLKQEVAFYEENDNCPVCGQNIDEDHRSHNINDKKAKQTDLINAVKKLEVEIEASDIRLEEITKIQREIFVKSNDVQNHNSQISSLNKYIVTMTKSMETKDSVNKNLDEEYKFVSEIRSTIKENEDLHSKYLVEKETLDIASELLKDKGIKTQIVKQYIPVMNKLINKYLAVMEFFVSFELNENFEEVNKSRHRDEFSYASFSEGEKARLDLALILTWRAIAKIKNSVHTNLLILDEVFSGSLDEAGTKSILTLLSEMEGVNIFNIMHSNLDALEDTRHSVIRFEKVKNFSVIV